MRGKTALLGIALMLVVCAAVVGNVTAQAQGDSSERVIQVSGTGKVTTTPDQAIIVFAVETENTDVKTAQQQNAQRMDAVINALKAAGIPAKDIKTAGYNIIQVTDTDDSGLITSKVRYYRVVNTLQVTLNDVGRAGEVVDLAVENGANRVNSLVFTLSDEKQQEYRSQALTAAVAQARGDADAVAAALGKSIVDVRDVNVGGSYVPMAYDNRYVMEQAAGAAVKTTPLEVGEIELTASVYITYTLS